MGIRFYNLNGFFVKKLAHGVKTIITYDKIHGDGIAGIEVVNLIDFLLEAY